MLKNIIISCLEEQPVSFNDIEERAQELKIFCNKEETIDYQPIHLTNCTTEIDIDDFLIKMMHPPYNRRILSINTSNSICDMDLLAYFPNLTSLNISDKDMTQEQLFDILLTSVNLTCLDISHNEINIAALVNLKSLNRLYIDSCDLDDEDVSVISTLSLISRLYMSDNPRIYSCDSLISLKCLTSLDISNNSIDADGVTELIKIKSLTSLDISNNPLGEMGAKVISDMKGLTSLQINMCGLTHMGTKYISECLTNLVFLNIGCNNIGNEGVRHISYGLKTNLRNLDICINNVDYDGLIFIAVYLVLDTLLIDDVIGPEGFEVLENMLNYDKFSIHDPSNYYNNNMTEQEEQDYMPQDELEDELEDGFID